MANLVNTSHAPRGERAAKELVEAVFQIGDYAEHHYLEAKGPLDLSAKATRAKLAKFILGAANRMPEKAATAFEGCAVMIVGVNAAGIEGIRQVEIMEISKVVSPFLGASGPQWDVIWVPIQGSANKVMVLVVEPPKYGQGPFVCRLDGVELVNGQIYVRGDGETRPAKADELDLLFKRGSVAQAPSVDFDVQILGEVRPVLLNTEQALEAYIERNQTRLLDALPKLSSRSITSADLQGLQTLGAAMAAINSVKDFMQTPEDRTESVYREQVEDWGERCRAAWDEAVLEVVGYSLPSVAIQLTNRARTFFHDVELWVNIEGSVSGVRYNGPVSRLSRGGLNLPSPPRRWGPRSNQYPPSYLLAGLSNRNYPTVLPEPSRLTWKNSESVELTLNAGDIRPSTKQVFEEEELVLLLTDDTVDQLHATWRITARGFNEVFEGEFAILVGEPIDLTPTISSLFNPHSKDNDSLEGTDEGL